MYKKGFSMDFIKMSLKMLGQKSIHSCYEPFASSILHIATSYLFASSYIDYDLVNWFATSYSLVTSYPIWLRIKRDLVFDVSS